MIESGIQFLSKKYKSAEESVESKAHLGKNKETAKLGKAVTTTKTLEIFIASAAVLSGTCVLYCKGYLLGKP